MAIRVELDQLLNLSLGTPELGAVNFNILHGVIREILNHLGIEKKAKDIVDNGHFKAAFALLKTNQESFQSGEKGEDVERSTGERGNTDKTPFPVAVSSPPFQSNLESKVASIEKRLDVLDDLPSDTEILQRSKQKKEGRTPVGDMWQFININRRLGATETGIEKLTSLLDTMMKEVSEVKETAAEIDDLKNKFTELEKLNSSLSERISALESVDNSEERKKMEDLLKEMQHLKKQVDGLPTMDDLNNLDIYVKWPQLEEALNARRSRTPSAKSRASTPKPRTPTPPPPRTPSPPHPSPEALEALRQIGELMDKHEVLIEQVDVLEEQMPKKANLEDLDELRKRPDVPDDILDQLKLLKDGLDAINKWKEEKTIPADLESQLASLREGLSLLNDNKQQIESMKEQLQSLKKVSDMLSYHNEKLQMIPDDLLDQLNKLKYLEKTITQMKEFNDQLPSRLQRIEDRLKEDTEREIRTLRDGLRLLNNQLEKYKKMRETIPNSASSGKGKDGDALSALRSMLTELQGEQEKLNSTTKELIEEHNRKQKHIDALYTYADRLQEVKADKEQVAMEMDVKADKRALDNLISRSKFDQSIGGLEQSMQELLHRLDGQESSLSDALARLAGDIDQKLDRLELDPLKDYFEKKIKNMKCKHVDLPLSDDPAAGFRKALLRFHCISCDRPVDMIPGHPNPALPQTPGLPPSRSGRPYTTFELDQIRQMHRGGYTYEQEVATTTARACGGSHTVTFPHRRTARFNQYYYYREDDTPVPIPPRDETELIGQDGHIYKGRFDGNMVGVAELPPQNPKSPRAMSAKRASSPQPPRNGSPITRRPRSAAVPTSPRNQKEEEVEPARVVVP
ncbi:glutamine-rich protein 2 isoform X1 [Pocillopora verrucosa]|uniref:glutamine-rich protein 2-like isoform X1 n=1 Tax=Pocillopora damicornis TaxID=46731 RepID=UPI000F55011C|nr:glutamine-rich protein 2-like isoform X1 [Pocillopora damicornis]